VIRCRFDGPQGYYDQLVSESAAGRLPAATHTGLCQYLTEDGRQCGVGQLFTADDAAVIESRLGGTVDSYPDTWRELLPPWLSRDDARRIQDWHDATDAEKWVHADWVRFLNQLPAFAGCRKVVVN
jgi:hypothetical protein